jgi:DNA polymerase III epsilon subunit-like protein
MVHLNGNLLCAVDVETTGIIPGFHDLIQVAALPLNADLEPLTTVPPFYMNLKPEYPERADYRAKKVTGLSMADLILTGVEKYRAADLFVEWFDRLNMPTSGTVGKKIMPLWSNGGFDKSFLLEWLGKETYNYIFHFHERDTQSIALFLNDRVYMHGEKQPFPKVGVSYLSSCFDIVNEHAHDALSDCLTTAHIYKRLMTMYTPMFPGAPRAEGPPVSFGKMAKPVESTQEAETVKAPDGTTFTDAEIKERMGL